MDWKVPRALFDAGKAPSVDRLEPGDILLFEELQPDYLQQAITRLQAERMASSHSVFTHVGIVIDRERFVEAELAGVQVSSLFDHCLTSRIKVRRATHLDIVARTRVALFAMCSLRQPYNHFYAIRSGLRDWWRRNIRAQDSEKAHRKAVICSQLFADAFAEATDQLAVPGRVEHILPGDLSHSPVFKDIPMQWYPLG